ncbi:hypothetical protein F2P81_001543 [Scophthalmus maximus]|uniref:Peptidase S8/S53 domain-containing protein n=1 Tax=Scophthalmus maximus TaxID=52904 RepID=A0A6A4TP53_SCOMX|nr:hypothetical protein F2P81_001543 [Scophthalmus maximus]
MTTVCRNSVAVVPLSVSLGESRCCHAQRHARVLSVSQEALASVDLCASHGPSRDPMPVRDEENSHGTRCAGEVAMEANNSYCGVGIAFNARIGGIRLLNGSVTDAMEATALTFNIHLIDIYVCSWGPRDDGAELDGPHVLTEQALRLGTHEGRGGKGSVFVWAAAPSSCSRAGKRFHFCVIGTDSVADIRGAQSVSVTDCIGLMTRPHLMFPLVMMFVF